MELAALASAAIPDLAPTGVVGSPDDPRDFSAAVVLDRQGNRWRVRSPRHEEAAMRLETELQVLSGFTPAVRAALPFRAPSVAGAVRIDGLRTFVYHDMPGRELEIEELAGLGPRGIDDIGRVIAAVHALPAEVVENADLPVYTADQFRQRRLNELDQAATTGRIPAVLLRRWENALEEMELWDFTPVVAHGDLHEDNLLVDRGRVVSVTGWTDLHIGDPADDFSWLASSGDQQFTDAVVRSYWQHRTGGTVADEHLMRRAALAAEFALAQWLVRGVANDDEDMAAEAEAMLLELRDDVEDHGGQEISLARPGPRPVTTPAAAAVVAAADTASDLGASAPASPVAEGTGSHAAGPPAPEARDMDDEDLVDGEDDEDDAVITDHDPVDTPEAGTGDEDGATEHAPEAGSEVGSENEGGATGHAPDEAVDQPGGDTGFSGSHRAEEPPTTTLDLDEVRQLRIERDTGSPS
ncbi:MULTISPECIES: phosphotransferase [Micrococcaceae]|uniref:phosphotransferase n=1 Tax=Micrococcaceae TaxID=1268 RepID=UPI0017EB7A51|nr:MULTISPECIES: phosphotransferase [Micrococcaceae]MBB5749344.1 aminoglycoside phosphotransferase (APT) family kinase protein [Micrococcus sp. TA1]HRO31394.1 phosphotransferase [Citricoccus sp.]HRO93942.1 phosphotransferase [Citricoccus sp.]